jgi:hypothetical protein
MYTVKISGAKEKKIFLNKMSMIETLYFLSFFGAKKRSGSDK